MIEEVEKLRQEIIHQEEEMREMEKKISTLSTQKVMEIAALKQKQKAQRDLEKKEHEKQMEQLKVRNEAMIARVRKNAEKEVDGIKQLLTDDSSITLIELQRKLNAAERRAEYATEQLEEFKIQVCCDFVCVK